MIEDSLTNPQPPEPNIENTDKPFYLRAAHFITTLVLWCIACVWLFPQAFYVGFSSGLDPSWQIALYQAYSKGLIWGREFVFTYGPLGFLSCRLAIPDFRWAYAALDIFLFLNVGYLAWIAIWRLNRWGERLGLLGVLFCAGSAINQTDLVIVLFLVQMMHLFLHQENRRVWHFVPAALCALLTFFVKLNMGLLTVPLLFAYCIWQLFYSDSRLAAILAVVGTALCIACSGLVLPVDVIPYIKYSISIASGYNDAMSVFIDGRTQYLTMGVFLLAVVLLSGLVFSWSILRSLGNTFRVACTGLLLFLLFKQGFVRADGHDSAFFGFVPMVLGVLYVSVSGALRSGLALAVTVSIVFGFAYHRDSFLPGYVTGDVKALSKYMEQALEDDQDWQKHASKGPEDNLPEEWIKRIGSKTVDVIPWDISTVFHNRLNYNPRPVMQSYSAYRPELDRLNADKYSSETRPDYVLFRLICIDGRYCFGDESQTQRALYQYYRPVALHAEFLLLQKRRKPFNLRTTEVGSGVAELGEWIDVPENAGFTYFNAEVQYSTFGKIKSALYRPDNIRYEIAFDEGGRRGFRSYRGALSSGVIASRFVDNLNDVMHYLDDDRLALQRVKAVRVVSPANFKGVDPRFNFKFYSINRDRVDGNESDGEEEAPEPSVAPTPMVEAISPVPSPAVSGESTPAHP